MPRKLWKNHPTGTQSLYFPKRNRTVLKSLLIVSSALSIGLIAMASRADERRLAAEMPPISYLEAGEASGFAVDIAKELSARIKLRKEIEVMPIARAIATLTTEKTCGFTHL